MNNRIKEKVGLIRDRINESKVDLESNKKELEGVQVIHNASGLLDVFEKTVSALGKRLADGIIQVFAREVKETNERLVKRVEAIGSKDSVKVTNLDEIKVPDHVKVSNLDEIQIPELNFPESMDVKVLGSADVTWQEPNETLFERDRVGKIREITQIYDAFTLITTFRRNLSGKIERINTIRKDY